MARLFIILFTLFSFALFLGAEEIIKTEDGNVYSGRIIKENKNKLFFQTKNEGVLVFDKKEITSVQFTQKWGLDGHLQTQDDNKTGKPIKKQTVVNPEKKQSLKSGIKTTVSSESISGSKVNKPGIVDDLPRIKYFPVKQGNWWRYNVVYQPQSLYGDLIPEKSRKYNLIWKIDSKLNKDDVYFANNRFNFGSVYKISVNEERAHSAKHDDPQSLYLGVPKDISAKSFLFMCGGLVGDKNIFYQRLFPLNPFLKQNKVWADTGILTTSKILSKNEIIGVEGVRVKAGFFDNCLLIERVDEVENQYLRVKSYLWFAPSVGMVKMVQEMVFPEVGGANKIKNFKFKEYALVNYGVK